MQRNCGNKITESSVLRPLCQGERLTSSRLDYAPIASSIPQGILAEVPTPHSVPLTLPPQSCPSPLHRSPQQASRDA